VVLADFSFWDFFWDVLLVMAWVIWFWLLITVFADLFRRHDTSGWAKVAWVVFLIVLPYLGVLVYLLVQHDGMAERNRKAAEASQQQLDAYVRQTAGGGSAADELTKLAKLHDEKKLSDAEFERAKAKIVA